MKIKLPSGEIRELSSTSRRKEAQIGSGEGLSKSERFLRKTQERFVESEQRIQQRGTIQGSVSEKFKQGLLGKLTAGLEVVAAPTNAIESAVSNVALKAQKGKLKQSKLLEDPKSPLRRFIPPKDLALLRSLVASQDLAEEASKGLGLQKQGQFGDVLKNAGLDPTISDATGLFMNVAGGIKILSAVGRTFGSISKMSDKGIIKSGKRLVQAANEGRDAVGAKVGEAFAPVANDLVDSTRFIDDVVKLPKAVLNKAEEVFGNMEDFANNLTVGKLREFKRFLGKLKPGSFGKRERGIVEKIDDMDFNRVYGAVKDIIRKSLKENHGKKVADRLMGLEETFSQVDNAGRVLKRAVTDSTLRLPTKAGRVAEGLVKEGDVTTRTALNIVKKSGDLANKSINKAVRLLELYNRTRLAASLVRSATRAAVFGGAAGAVGGKALRRATGEE